MFTFFKCYGKRIIMMTCRIVYKAKSQDGPVNTKTRSTNNTSQITILRLLIRSMTQYRFTFYMVRALNLLHMVACRARSLIDRSQKYSHVNIRYIVAKTRIQTALSRYLERLSSQWSTRQCDAEVDPDQRWQVWILRERGDNCPLKLNARNHRFAKYDIVAVDYLNWTVKGLSRLGS